MLGQRRRIGLVAPRGDHDALPPPPRGPLHCRPRSTMTISKRTPTGCTGKGISTNQIRRRCITSDSGTRRRQSSGRRTGRGIIRERMYGRRCRSGSGGGGPNPTTAGTSAWGRGLLPTPRTTTMSAGARTASTRRGIAIAARSTSSRHTVTAETMVKSAARYALVCNMLRA